MKRKPVARGVAIGLAVGFILPLGQTPIAALLSIPARANVIVAAVATLITNPITFGPIYFAAYRLGNYMLGDALAALKNAELIPSWLVGFAVPTLVGALIMGAIAGLCGYSAVMLGWRWRLSKRWLERRRTD